jgi:hypothetical protein
MTAKHVSQNQWMKDLFGYELEAFLKIPAQFRGCKPGCPMAEGLPAELPVGRTFRNHDLLPKARENAQRMK